MACWSAAQVEAAERACAVGADARSAHDGSWPMKIVARRGRGRPRRDQHVGLPRGRRLAPLAGPPRPAVRAPALADGPRRRSTAWSRQQLPVRWHPWTPEWPTDGPARRVALRLARASTSTARRLALAELLDDPQPEWELAGRPARPRGARAPRPVPGQVDLLDGLVLPGARRRRPRRGRRTTCSRPLGRLRGARPRRPLRRHQPVGHRRRDLRAGPGPRRARRPRAARSRCFGTCSTCASDDGRYWTGYVYPDDVHWPAEHTTYTTAAVLLAVRRARRGRRAQRPPARASCAAPRWRDFGDAGAGVRLRVSRRARRPSPDRTA